MFLKKIFVIIEAMVNEKLVSFILRAGLAIVFLYAAIASFIEPTSWIGFLPPWISSIMPATTALTLFSIYEIALTFWLFSGKRVYYAAMLSILTMAGIVVFNMASLDIVFRDVAIMFSAIALAVIHKNDR